MSFMVSYFIGGLKEEIRLSVQMLRPCSLPDAIGLARMQEEKVNARRRAPRFEPGKSGLNPNPNISKNSTPIIKRLTPPEMEERRKKGLCYNCDEKFAPGHRCKV